MIKTKLLLPVFTFLGLICLTTTLVSAVIPSSEVTPATDDTTVSVTVVEQTLGPVLIVSPSDYASLNTAQPSLVWQRPDPYPPTPVDTYDVYLDGSPLAEDVPEDLSYQEYFFYTLSRSLDVFTLEFTSDLAQGYHTWQVFDYNWIPLTNSSAIMHFYIDTIAPNFTLVDVDTNQLNWDTSNSYTIPTIDHRYLTTTQTPVFSGTAENGSNLQILIKCPTGLSGCTDTTEVINIQDGLFEYTAPELEPNQTYSIYMNSRDSADNTASLPVFYINYPYTAPTTTATATPTPTATATPTPTPTTYLTPTPTSTVSATITPTPTATVSATPTPEEYPTPTPAPELGEPGVPDMGFEPPSVPKPTPPPAVAPKVREPISKNTFLPLVIFLLVIGLPLHLIATQFGRDIYFKQTLLFLYSLLFPFISKKKYQTVSFSYLTFYDPQTNKQVYSTVSDIFGLYNLKEGLSEKLFIKIHSYNRYFEPAVKNIKELSSNCLLPRLKRYQTRLERLQGYSYEYRIIPLIIGLLTALVSMFVYQQYFLLIYLYLSLQAIYSEYIYQG